MPYNPCFCTCLFLLSGGSNGWQKRWCVCRSVERKIVYYAKEPGGAGGAAGPPEGFLALDNATVQESNSEESPAIRIVTSGTFDQSKTPVEYWLRGGLQEAGWYGVDVWLMTLEAMALSSLPFRVERVG